MVAMTDAPAFTQLRDHIHERRTFIPHTLVIRAIHEMLDHSLEAANEVEDLLVKAGYEQSNRGDWNIFT